MILFQKWFRDQILEGGKTETRRLGKKRWNVGSIHMATTNRFDPAATFAQVLIQEVEEVRIGDIDDEGARREGFHDRSAFLTTFHHLNLERLPAIGWQDEYCWRVRFKVVSS